MKLALHRQMANQEISDILKLVAGVLKAQDADRYRVAAYENAAAAIKTYPTSLKDLPLQQQSYDDIPAVGESISAKLLELFKTGNVKSLQSYVKKIPAGFGPLLRIPGVGGKTAYKLATEFKLNQAETALDQLRLLAQAGQIRQLPGFGEKSEQELLDHLQLTTAHHQRISYNKAHLLSKKIIGYLIANKNVLKAEVLGSIRRQAPTVGDIDIGIATTQIDAVKNMENVKRLIVAGDNLIRIILNPNIQVDLKLSPPVEWGSFLQHFTGSKEHNILLRQHALTQHLSLSEHGIKKLDPQNRKVIKKLQFTNEKDFYHALGLEWIPPKNRVGKNELDRYTMGIKATKTN